MAFVYEKSVVAMFLRRRAVSRRPRRSPNSRRSSNAASLLDEVRQIRQKKDSTLTFEILRFVAPYSTFLELIRSYEHLK